MKQIHLLGFSLLLIALTAVMAVGAQEDTTVLPTASIDVNPTTTILAFPARTESDLNELGATIALPSSATNATARILSGNAGGVEIASDIMKQRGISVVVVRVLEPGLEAIEVEVRHNGSWFAKADDKYASPVMHAGLPGMMDNPAKSAAHPMGGSYVIITAPEFEEVVTDLADWKREKGWPVVIATTDETGSSTTSIQEWLKNAYDNWDRPPEYVLLMGDVEVIPNWLFSGNVSDMPYVLLDGDDWLPDAMIGRFAVANNSEAETIVAKSIAYEMDPYMDETEWFTRSVMVAGNYGSVTPSRTVSFCNEQLESLGFAGLDTASIIPPHDLDGNFIVSPVMAEHGFGIPQQYGREVITNSVNQGSSMVIYRGWARGTDGWEFPEFVQDHLGGLTNGSMMPVVMSFVCLNNNFAAPQCFGEAWIREGTPEAFKGGVAFIGNGEHHSHTRHNDAMAISMFERVTDPEITTLGALLNAGKLRFIDYFPGELTALPGNDEEECVEFYFHIYNLLGDPELNYHRAVPTTITVDHLAQVATGSNMINVSAYEADGSTPLTGARVGIVQDGKLMGAGFVNSSGQVSIVLAEPAAQGSLTVTVSRADRIPHQDNISVGNADAFLAIESLAVGESPDTVIAPGLTLSLVPTIRNYGSLTADGATLTLTVEGPATVTQETASLEDALNGGESDTPAPAFTIDVDAGAANGAFITGTLSIVYTGSEGPDVSAFELVVDGPSLVLTSVGAQDGGGIEPGLTTDLALAIVNDGSQDTAGGTLELSLVGPPGVTLLTETASLPSIMSGEEGVISPVSLQVAADVAEGTALTMQISATTSEGATQVFTHGFLVGDNASDAPAGPSAYGYYAYDSADYLYPDQRPIYRWSEISTAFGGVGTQLVFYNPEEGIDDNTATDVKVGLPFDFTYFGQNYSANVDSIRVSDNGWASLDADDDFFNFYNWPIPSTHGNSAVIAPFWDNLNPGLADAENDTIGLDSDGVYWHFDDANHELIVEWSRMRFYKPSEIPVMQTFQMVLRDPAHYSTPTGDGEILFFYKQVADIDFIRMFATVGIESPDETDGLQLTYDSVLLNGMAPFGPGHAIRMTTAAPVRVPLEISAFQGRVMGDQVNLSWVLNDERPVIGWRVLSQTNKGLKSLTETMIPGEARSVTVTAALDDDLVLEAVMPHGASSAAGTLKVGQSIQTSLALGQPRPNPVRGESSIAFALPRSGHMKLRIFDIRGRVVRTLIDGRAEAGDGLVIWKGRDDSGRQLADGVYFYRIEHGGENLTHKLLLVR